MQDQTLNYKQFCDGRFDCPDLSDELLCTTKRVSYKNRLQYVITRFNLDGDGFWEDSAVELSKRLCIPNINTLESVNACGYCNPSEFACDSFNDVQKTNNCVTISKICDGKIDCSNAQDEKFCAAGNLLQQVFFNTKV